MFFAVLVCRHSGCHLNMAGVQLYIDVGRPVIEMFLPSLQNLFSEWFKTQTLASLSCNNGNAGVAVKIFRP